MLPAAFWCFEGVPAKSAGPGLRGLILMFVVGEVTELIMANVKGRGGVLVLVWLRLELSSIRNGVRSASRICKVFWPRTVSIVSTWRACFVR